MFGHDDAISSNSNTNNQNLPDPSMMPEPPTASAALEPANPDVGLPQIPKEEHNLNPIASTPPLSTADTPSKTDSAASSDLLDIKQKAVEQLAPLVSKLDQNPEEKFHTTMMMIQATDNQKLLKEAYEAAQNITDEKARAQALLDVVNEINYFTQKEQ